MTVMQAIEARRSIRQYTDAPVTDEELLAVLEAGRLAPSARNLQSWHFTAVRDAALRSALCEACNGQQMVGQAPVALVIWSDSERMMGCGQSAATIDCSIALSFMLLRAAELGLGSCWLGNIDRDDLSALLNLRPGYVLHTMVALGYPAESPAAFDEAGSIRYFKDASGRLHVPKRHLNDVLVYNRFE